MSDSALEEALVVELVGWLVSPGVPTPPPLLQRLYGAYRARFLRHTARCTCEECFADLYGVQGLVDDLGV